MLKVNHKELNTLIKEYYKKKISLFVIGAFGIGKSFVVRDTAKEIGESRGRKFVEWNKLTKKEKQEVFEYPEKYFVLIDERLSEYDSCLTGDSLINLTDGSLKPIKDIKKGDKVIGYKDGKKTEAKVIEKWNKGISKEGIVKIYLKNGEIIKATKQHKFLTEEGWKKTKDLKPSNILYLLTSKENEKNKIHKNGKEVCKRELQKDEGEGVSKSNEQKQVRDKHISKGYGNTEELQGSIRRKGNKFKQFNRSRKGIFSRDNRRRGNDLFRNTKTIQQETQPNFCFIQTKNNDKQYKQKIIGLVFKQNENKSRNIQKKKSNKKNTIHNRDEWIQNTTYSKNSSSLFGNKKRTSKNIDELDRKKKEIEMEGYLYRKGQKTTFRNEKTQFKPCKIRRIDYKNENRQIFDITTSTGNYLVNGIVCHNSDIKGLPNFKDGKETIEWSIPFWAKFLTLENSDGLVFFDEINLATPLVISSVYKIIYDRIVNDSKINNNWLIVGAGNREEDRAFTHTLPAPVRDRGGEVELITPDVDSWTDWATQNEIDSRIIGFINFKPSSLYKVDFNDNQKYTTARGFERLSRLIKDVKDWASVELLSCSAIGEGIAKEFVAFCKIQDKFKLEEIIKNPSKIEKIEDISVKYFLVSAVAEKYKDKKVDFNKIIEISKVFDKINNSEFVALLWRLSNSYTEQFKKDFLNCKEDKFIERYGKFLI